MKVLHIGKYYPPFFGGIEKVNFDIVEGLNKLGIETDVLCFNHGKEKIIKNSSYNIFRSKTTFRVFSTPISFQLFSILRKIKNNYDIIHLHLPNPIGSIALQLSGYKGKVVLHWHCDIVKQKKLKFLYKPFQTYILKRADKIIATSEAYLNYSEDLKPFKEKSVVIPIGIDHTEFKENLEFRYELENRLKGKKLIFSLGRLTYYKGFEYLIRASVNLPDDIVVMIGGTGELKGQLSELIRKLDLEKKVILLGSIAFYELGEYYRKADIFCLPSCERTEAFGVVLLEAMSFGCPIVTCNLIGSGVPWVVQHKYNGEVVDPKNSGQIADAVQTILEEKNIKNVYGENSISRFNDLFQNDNMIKSTKLLYDNLI